MRSEFQVLVGLACIAMGAAGLAAMNLWTIPDIVANGNRGARTAHAQQPAQAEPPAQAEQPGVGAGSDTPAPAVQPAASTDVASPNAEELAVEPATGNEADTQAPAAGSTTTTDGTALPSIRFQPEEHTASATMIEDAIAPIAKYLLYNFSMKAMLVGHGDDATSASEYVEAGNRRAAAVRFQLRKYGVLDPQIGITPPAVQGDRVLDLGVPPGTVEVRIDPRFQQKKGGDVGP